MKANILPDMVRIYKARVIDQIDMPYPPLDMLVREAVQNSLDAKEGAEVEVSFDLADISSADLAKALSDETDPHARDLVRSIVARLGDKPSVLLVRDSGTKGLVGDHRFPANTIKDEKENRFQRLVYDIGEPNVRSEAGGSWGLGKLIPFVLSKSVGLCWYFSRRSDGSVVFMMSHIYDYSADGNGAYPAWCPTGYAWWGQATVGRFEALTGQEAMKTRNRIMEIDGVDSSSWQGTEVGVILSEDDVLSLCQVEGSDPDDSDSNPWTSQGAETRRQRVLELIERASWRWFWPRLAGPPKDEEESSGLSDLKIRVADQEVKPNGQLYGYLKRLLALGMSGRVHNGQAATELTIGTPTVKFATLIQGEQGFSLHPEFVSELQKEDAVCRCEGDRFFTKPWVALVRNFGMVLRYDTSLAQRHEGEAFPARILKINGEARFKHLSVEECFRFSENDAHSRWDKTNLTRRRNDLADGKPLLIHWRSKVREALRPEVDGAHAQLESGDSFTRISRMFGSALLGSSSFGIGGPGPEPGNNGGTGDTGGAGQGPTRSSKSRIIEKQLSFFEGIQHWRLVIAPGARKSIAEIVVVLEDGSCRDASHWSIDFPDLEFPAEIVSWGTGVEREVKTSPAASWFEVPANASSGDRVLIRARVQARDECSIDWRLRDA